jgi:two-component system, cell cycle sensor histidine kinase and response regulator CckA
MNSPASTAAETILVVDDDQEILALATDILQMAGYTVLSTADPRHALRLARAHVEPIHLLLTDVVMPLMSGLQLAEEVRGIHPETKILPMSGFRTEEIEAYRIRLAPRGLFLDKPFTVDWLGKTVREALDCPTGASWPRPR